MGDDPPPPIVDRPELYSPPSMKSFRLYRSLGSMTIPTFAPKEHTFAQPRATPWGTGQPIEFSGPTGQPFSFGRLPTDERRTLGPLGRSHNKKWREFPSPGRCPGLDEWMAFQADRSEAIYSLGSIFITRSPPSAVLSRGTISTNAANSLAVQIRLSLFGQSGVTR
jgi:hypothetical protein